MIKGHATTTLEGTIKKPDSYRSQYVLYGDVDLRNNKQQ